MKRFYFLKSLIVKITCLRTLQVSNSSRGLLGVDEPLSAATLVDIAEGVW